MCGFALLVLLLFMSARLFTCNKSTLDEAYADYAEVSESDSLSLARGLGLGSEQLPTLYSQNQQNPLKLVLVDPDSQVLTFLLSAFCTPLSCGGFP